MGNRLVVKSYALGVTRSLSPRADLRPPFDRQARTVKKGGVQWFRDAYVGADRRTEDSFIYVPRWVEYIGDKSLPGSLAEVFSPEVARSGIMFIRQFQAFKQQQLAALTPQLKKNNLSNLEMHFVVSGIVQNCGAQAILQRLWTLVRLGNKGELFVDDNKGGADELKIRVTGDLFSASLLMGILTPHLSMNGATLSPRIFHGIDIGEEKAPDNLVVVAVNEQPVDLPLAKYFYTVNIENVGKMQARDAKITRETNILAARLKDLAHRFMIGI